MSGLIALVQRWGAGSALRRVRLIDAQGQAGEWEAPAPETGDSAEVLEQVRAAAAWIATHAKASGAGSRARLDALCIDTDGALCAWLRAPGTQRSVLTASLTMAAAGTGEDGAVGDWIVGELGEARSLEALAPPVPSGRSPARWRKKPGAEASAGETPAGAAAGATRRFAVLSVPDAAARLLLDELDAQGVEVAETLSLWHALARGLDPSATPESAPLSRDEAERGQRVVSRDQPLTACVLVDREGVLNWAWSRGGELLAAGGQRLRAGEREVRWSADDVGRLTADWLGWSLELGEGPARVVMLAPEHLVAEAGAPAPADAGVQAEPIGKEPEDGPEGSVGGGSALGLVKAIAERWPGAAVDAALARDPQAALLSRVVIGWGGLDLPASSTGRLAELSGRPGRAHRAMYRWSGVAIAGLALLVGALGYRWHAQAGAHQRAIEQVREQRRTLLAGVESLAPGVLTDESPVRVLQGAVGRLRGGDAPEPRPMLEELARLVEAAAEVEGVELQTVHLFESLNSARMTVPEAGAVARINERLREIPGQIEWTGTLSPGREGEPRQFTLTGRWPERRPVAGGGAP